MSVVFVCSFFSAFQWVCFIFTTFVVVVEVQVKALVALVLVVAVVGVLPVERYQHFVAQMDRMEMEESFQEPVAYLMQTQYPYDREAELCVMHLNSELCTFPFCLLENKIVE